MQWPYNTIGVFLHILWSIMNYRAFHGKCSGYFLIPLKLQTSVRFTSITIGTIEAYGLPEGKQIAYSGLEHQDHRKHIAEPALELLHELCLRYYPQEDSITWEQYILSVKFYSVWDTIPVRIFQILDKIFLVNNYFNNNQV